MSEDSSVLLFEPERVAYDPEDDVLRFFANAGAAVIRCAVSKAALAELACGAVASRDAMLNAYRRNRKLIQEIAERKYRAHRYETGNVVVRLQDLSVWSPSPTKFPA
jgi:Protein of unknown function (DUF1488)